MRCTWMAPVLVSITLGVAACGEEDDQGDHHGDVSIEMHRAENEPGHPYAGTQAVSITLDYLGCLVDFYTAQPEWRQEGPLGAPVFEAWEDRLCPSSNVECTVESIEQDLDASPPHLTVRYDVTSPIENRELLIGPLPDAELAGCEPLVRLGRIEAQ